MVVYRCMKYILLVFNSVLMLLGAVGLGLSIWALVSDFGANEMKSLTGSGQYEAACVGVMLASGIVFVTSLLGCCGAWSENRCLLGAYFVVMLLFMCIFVVVAVSIFYYRSDLEDQLARDLEQTMLYDYGDLRRPAITAAWDKMQMELSCCGVRGDRVSRKSWFLWQRSAWRNDVIKNDPTSRLAVPRSCCVSRAPCQKLNSDPNMAPQRNLSHVTKANAQLSEDGCIDRLKEETSEYLVAIGATAVVIFVIMFFCVVFSVCVCTHGGGNRHEYVM